MDPVRAYRNSMYMLLAAGILVLVVLLAGCSGESPSPTGATQPTAVTANLVATVSYQGECLNPNGYPARCDVVFYRDYDLGGLQSWTKVSTWVMRSPVDLVKDRADFKFKARYRFGTSVSAWSPTIAFHYVPGTGATVFDYVSGPIMPGAPPVNRLVYTWVP